MSSRPGLSESELEVLRALWESGAGTVRALKVQLAARGRSWAYTTVATLLQRLAAKGYVHASADGPAHVFRAAVSRGDLVESRLRAAANELCDGSAAPLVLALVQGNRFSPEELARFREMIDRAQAHDPEDPGAAKKRKKPPKD